MIQVFLVILACVAPDFTYCKRMLIVERPDPITCQFDRLPIGGVWQLELREKNLYKWSIFTHCEFVKSERTD
jgi:hypothetical protein